MKRNSTAHNKIIAMKIDFLNLKIEPNVTIKMNKEASFGCISLD